MTEWNLPPGPPIVTDDASNMTVVAEELGTSLACGEALKLPVSHLLARMR